MPVISNCYCLSNVFEIIWLIIFSGTYILKFKLTSLYWFVSSEDAKKLSHGFAFECYYCGKFFVRADKQKRYIENCSGVPGIVYNFYNKNLITFEDNFKSKGDILIAMYSDFEATAPTDNFQSRTKKCLLCLMF